MSAPARRLTLEVPALAERPYVSVTCCAAPASELVAGELRSWRRWVQTVEVDGTQVYVDLAADVDDPPLEYMLEALDDLGCPAAIQTASARQS